MTDPQTIGVYDAQAAAYAAAFDDIIPADLIDFAALLPFAGRVLDLGCGPGAMAAWLAEQGFEVEAWDASAEMIALADRRPGVIARQKTFDELPASPTFDGIWASFSLLHAARSDLPDLIRKLARALRPEGHAYVAMKLGTGEARDGLGRQYAYVSEAELVGWIKDAGLSLVARRLGHGVGLAGTDDPHVTVTARA